MHSTIETWVQDLVDEVDDAVSSEQFTEWLERSEPLPRLLPPKHAVDQTPVSACNARCRLPNMAKRVRPTDVKEGETAIWIWAPHHRKAVSRLRKLAVVSRAQECEYDETPPDSWEKGLVGFRPAPVFDISQTDGEPLPDLETEARGQADELVPALLEAADTLEVDVEVVSPQDWSHGSAKGVCQYRPTETAGHASPSRS